MSISIILDQLKLVKQEFLFQFQFNPNYPSALAFSDTLNIMGVKKRFIQFRKRILGKNTKRICYYL